MPFKYLYKILVYKNALYSTHRHMDMARLEIFSVKFFTKKFLNMVFIFPSDFLSLLSRVLIGTGKFVGKFEFGIFDIKFAPLFFKSLMKITLFQYTMHNAQLL